MGIGHNGWGIYDLNGWGIYDLNGWGIHDLNGWGMYDLKIGGAIMTQMSGAVVSFFWEICSKGHQGSTLSGPRMGNGGHDWHVVQATTHSILFVYSV